MRLSHAIAFVVLLVGCDMPDVSDPVTRQLRKELRQTTIENRALTPQDLVEIVSTNKYKSCHHLMKPYYM